MIRSPSDEDKRGLCLSHVEERGCCVEKRLLKRRVFLLEAHSV